MIPYRRMDSDDVGRIFDHLVRRGDLFMADEEDVLGLAPEAGPQALFSRMFVAFSGGMQILESPVAPRSPRGDDQEGTCQICLGLMANRIGLRCGQPRGGPPGGHLFHAHCARQWARSQACAPRQDNQGRLLPVNLVPFCPTCQRDTAHWLNGDDEPDDGAGGRDRPASGRPDPAAGGATPNRRGASIVVASGDRATVAAAANLPNGPEDLEWVPDPETPGRYRVQVVAQLFEVGREVHARYGRRFFLAAVMEDQGGQIRIRYAYDQSEAWLDRADVRHQTAWDRSLAPI